MKTKTFIGMAVLLMTLAGMTACDNDDNNPASGNTTPTEYLYGEWWLVGWNNEGTWFEVDTNYVCHQHLSIEINEEGYTRAYSSVNVIFVGLLTLNGKEMIFGGENKGEKTLAGCSLKESNFFEKHICDIKSYQFEGNLLRLYYSDDDYFVFTKDFDDSEEHLYAWKNGVADPYIGEVTAISNEEVEVKIVHYPSSANYYYQSEPPYLGDPCRFAASDLSGLSFEVGDKIAFQIIQFRRLKVDKGREYQCVVKPGEGSEHVTDMVGVMHFDTHWKWWTVMVITDDTKNSAIFYYLMKPLPDSYLSEGLPVVFSGALYPTWVTPSQLVYHADSCYFVSIDEIENNPTGPISPVMEGDDYAVIADFFQSNYRLDSEYRSFFEWSDPSQYLIINNLEELLYYYKGTNPFPEIDFNKYTLIVGQEIMPGSYYSVLRQELVHQDDGWILNVYVPHMESWWDAEQHLFYWGLYPKKQIEKISVKIIEESTEIKSVPIDEDVRSFIEEKLYNTENLVKDRFSIKENTCYRIDSKQELEALYQGTDKLPEIDYSKYTLLLGAKVYFDADTDTENYKQVLYESKDGYDLNFYSRHMEGNWGALSITLQIYYYGLYPKLKDKEINVNLIYE